MEDPSPPRLSDPPGSSSPRRSGSPTIGGATLASVDDNPPQSSESASGFLEDTSLNDIHIHHGSVSSVPATRKRTAAAASAGSTGDKYNGSWTATAPISSTTAARGYSPRRDPGAARGRRGLRSKSPHRTTTAPASSGSRAMAPPSQPQRATTSPFVSAAASGATNLLEDTDDDDDDDLIALSRDPSPLPPAATRRVVSTSPVRRTPTPRDGGPDMSGSYRTNERTTAAGAPRSRSPVRRTRTQLPPALDGSHRGTGVRSSETSTAAVIADAGGSNSKSPVRRTRTQVPTASQEGHASRSLSPRRGLANKSAQSREQADMEAKQRAKWEQQGRNTAMGASASDLGVVVPPTTLGRAVTEVRPPRRGGARVAGAHAVLQPTMSGGSARSIGGGASGTSNPPCGLSRQDWHAKFGADRHATLMVDGQDKHGNIVVDHPPSSGQDEKQEEPANEEYATARPPSVENYFTDDHHQEQPPAPGVTVQSVEETRQMMHRKADELFSSTNNEPNMDRNLLTAAVLRNSTTATPEMAIHEPTTTAPTREVAATSPLSWNTSAILPNQERGIRQSNPVVLASSGALQPSIATTSSCNNGTMDETFLVVQPPPPPPGTAIVMGALGELQDNGAKTKLRDDEMGLSAVVKIVVGVFCAVLLVVIVVVVVVVVVAGGANKDSTANSVSMMELSATVFSTVPNVTMSALQKDDPTLPQSQALVWLSEDPNLDSYEEWQVFQLFALATLFYSLSGPQWQTASRRDAWLQYGGTHGCDWNPVECGADGRVEGLPFTTTDTGMKGALPPEISLLTRLKSVEIAADLNVALQDFAPPEMVSLSSSLQVLGCIKCGLRGTIPTYLGKLASLRRLELTANALSSTIPSELSELGQLVKLLLGDNKLNSTIPSELGLLSSLDVLELGHAATPGTSNIAKPNEDAPPRYGDGNALSGPIPSTLGNVSHLTSLLLGDNMLTGALPTELGQLSRLTSMEIHHNKLTGNIPSEYGLLAALKILDLYGNALSGSIPPSIGKATHLQEIQLQENNISGTLPSELGQLWDLYVFFIRHNPGITPPIPTTMCSDIHSLEGSNFQTDWCGWVKDGVSQLCCS